MPVGARMGIVTFNLRKGGDEMLTLNVNFVPVARLTLS